MKIYVAAAAEALRKKEREDETQFITKIDDGFFGNEQIGFLPNL